MTKYMDRADKIFFAIFKNGEVVDKQVGAVPKQKLTEKLDYLL